MENALAAITVAYNFNIDLEIIKKALENFNGVKRRLTKIYEKNNITFYDDYAHHPTEIKETIKALKSFEGRLISVVQPHRYSRLRDNYKQFLKSFSGSDLVLILPVYEAGEKKIDSLTSEIFNGVNLIFGPIILIGTVRIDFLREAWPNFLDQTH